MNTHALLKAYHGREDYSEIARFAASLETNDEAETLRLVAQRFGITAVYGENSAPITLFGEIGVDIPQGAYDQLETAMQSPVAVRGALMPDAHVGYALPIGGVAELHNAASPSYIGYDISCMVMLSILDIMPDDFMAHRRALAEDLRAETSFGVGVGFNPPREHEVMDDPLWNEIKVANGQKRKAQTQLGSSGGGNHFADLVVGEYTDGAEFVGLLTHSGSRGAGHKLATYYTKLADELTRGRVREVPKGHGWLDMERESGQEYYAVMQLMGRYALANHELIHKHFPARAGLSVKDNIWVRHNYAWQEGDGIIHRKGATPSAKGQDGIIPGTSSTPSYLTVGLGNQESMQSSSHGAGRPFSRTEAKKRHDQAAYKDALQKNDVLHFGVAQDETYQAYKDIEDVIAAQEGVLVNTVAKMYPKVVIMGGKVDDGD
ncbi:MAG: RtcB family protein [Chloroflexi bacterium]|nr:MAG: RtcB family protein [Chloroflexota bacterium]MBL1193070.1 RtcB family protein [Chloroflexota bacterium]NOH10363.1 RtcB family protein [Chloroflexota bacterium]